jgi:adenylate cyclase
MVTDPTSLKAVLQMALGTNGIVKKTRMLSHFNQKRIHIDEVVGLGNFLELEVSLPVVHNV